MSKAEKYRYIFGPVPSRRLGKSLGVDIVPLKTCTQNCVYCQLGVDGVTTTERKPYVDMGEVLAELKDKLRSGVDADFITLSGSGEPTLNSQISELIAQAKAMSDIPVAVITNGTLLSDPDVRRDIIGADVVMPSLDAGDEEPYRAMNCPHVSLTLKKLVDGLIQFRQEFAGQVWLEVFFCDGVNASASQVEKIKSIIERIGPDKIQINTAVRPTAKALAVAVSPEKLAAIAEKFGPTAEVIANFSKSLRTVDDNVDADTIAAMLKRRPCSLDGICSSLGISESGAVEILNKMLDSGIAEIENKGGKLFYRLK